MRKVFLSHSFQDRDRALVGLVERVIRSHGLVLVVGRNLGGGELTEEVAKLIEDADGCVALLTRRENDPGNLTHPWVLQEYGHARFLKKPAVGLYEKGVPQQGAAAAFERIDLDPADAGPAFVKLSEVIGEWRRRAGRLIKVQLMPEAVARDVGKEVDRITCEFRCQVEEREGEWQKARIVREVGGVFGYLRVPEETEMVRLRVSGAGLSCDSPYTPLRMVLELERS